MDIIQLTWHMDDGLEGQDNDQHNPLWRSLQVLLREGRPIRRLSMTFLEIKDSSLSDFNIIHWFGVFVYSASRRIVLFPGFSFVPTRVHVVKNNAPAEDIDFQLDHLTVEPDLRSWHITSPNSANHKRTARTYLLGEGRVLLFGLSVQSSTIFRPVKRDTLVEVPCSATDIERRSRIFTEAREGAQFNTIQTPVLNTHYPEGYFVHFAVIAGPSGFPLYDGNQLGLPVGSPFLTASIPNVFHDHPIRTHRIELAPELDIQVSAFFLPGQLTVPVTMTNYSAT